MNQRKFWHKGQSVDSGSDSLHLGLSSALVTRPCASYVPSFGSGSTYIKQGQQYRPQEKIVLRIKWKILLIKEPSPFIRWGDFRLKSHLRLFIIIIYLDVVGIRLKEQEIKRQGLKKKTLPIQTNKWAKKPDIRAWRDQILGRLTEITELCSLHSSLRSTEIWGITTPSAPSSFLFFIS